MSYDVIASQPIVIDNVSAGRKLLFEWRVVYLFPRSSTLDS